jgi:hypothetical protein
MFSPLDYNDQFENNEFETDYSHLYKGGLRLIAP